MKSSLHLDNVGCGYPFGLQLQNINAKLSAGDVCAILGPNGAGKTTLLKAITGTLRLNSGQVLLAGTDIHKVSPFERARHIAYVPQALPELTGLSVLETLRISAYPCGYSPFGPQDRSASAALALLKRFGLEQHASRQTSSLSGGEMRRLMLAQGLIQLGESGGVLLLDEPTAFLDPPARSFIAATAASIARQESRTVVMVLHEPELALAHASHLLLLREGRCLAFGPTEELHESALLAQLYRDETLLSLQGMEAA